MDKTEQLVKLTAANNFVEFQKEYLGMMREKFKENENIVRKYVFKQISTGKPTYIG